MKYGLIGKDVTYSYSSIIHKSLTRQDYELLSLNEDEVKSFISKKEYEMVNITNPYKKLAFGLVDVVMGEDVGCINTIINDDGLLLGVNTDYLGLKDVLKNSKIKIRNKDVVIMGSGATSQMIKHLCTKLKAKRIRICSRSSDYDLTYDELNLDGDVEVLFNATPVGNINFPDKSTVNLEKLSKLEAVVDLVYNPYNTNLIKQARIRGLKIGYGLDMLIYQAMYSRLILGDLEDFDFEKLKAQIRIKHSNVYLIGMMGSGKSSIGLALSKKLGMSFIDLDLEIVKLTKKPVKDIILEQGIEAFRKIETECLLNLNTNNSIISLGGGSVLTKDNIIKILDDGIVIQIKRNLRESFNSINDGTRPLALNYESFKQIYKDRIKIYDYISDYTFINKNIDEVVLEISKLLK